MVVGAGQKNGPGRVPGYGVDASPVIVQGVDQGETLEDIEVVLEEENERNRKNIPLYQWKMQCGRKLDRSTNYLLIDVATLTFQPFHEYQIIKIILRQTREFHDATRIKLCLIALKDLIG